MNVRTVAVLSFAQSAFLQVHPPLNRMVALGNRGLSTPGRIICVNRSHEEAPLSRLITRALSSFAVCSVCQEKHMSTPNFRCVDCQDNTIDMAAVAGNLLAFTVIIVLVWYMLSGTHVAAYPYFRRRRAMEAWKRRLQSFKIVVVAWQILTQVRRHRVSSRERSGGGRIRATRSCFNTLDTGVGLVLIARISEGNTGQD